LIYDLSASFTFRYTKKTFAVKHLLFNIFFISGGLSGFAQFTVNSPITLTGGAQITVVDLDINATEDITGSGTILLKSGINTNLNCNGKQLPSVTIETGPGATINMTSNAVVNNTLQFNSGKLNTNNSDLILANTAITAGATSANYIVNNGAGKVVKNMDANLTAFVLPIGTLTNYEPVFATTVGTYAAGANISARVVDALHPNKPAQCTDNLNVYWPLSRTGISGTVDIAGEYLDATNIVGTESKIKAAMHTASGWQNNGTNNDAALNRNAASLTTLNADLFGMNSFVQCNAKAFLQGAYNNTTLKMSDALRSPTNLIPLSDPYRVAPYNSSFAHVNNATVEVVNATVFSNQANTDNNIVDWVFLELRNSAIGAAGSNKIKTRSALIQRDGDIVDIDGISPVFFKDVEPGQYTLAVRHRNHLGLSTDPIANLQTLGMQNVPSTVDFTIFSDAQLFGKADSNYKVQAGKNLLYAGNANSNTRVSFSGLNSDKDRIFSKLGNQPNNLTVNNVYDASDVNMNRAVRFVNLNNDKDFLFGVLGNSALTTKNQALP
jgi:hypothetical protein